MAKKEMLSLDELLEQAFVKDEDKPYDIPSNWVWMRLGSVCKTISKGTTPKGGNDSYKDIGIGFLRVENINENGNIDLSALKFTDEETHFGFLKRSILEDDDILISIAGSLGRTTIVKKNHLPLNTNQAICFVRLLNKENINIQYVEKVISSPTIQILLKAQTKVTSIPNLTLEIISGCLIPFPPLSEQQRIVDLIQSLFEKLDRAKELAQNALDSFKNRKAAILHKAFTGELTAKWREKNGVEFERDWVEKKLGNCGQWCGGGTPSTSNPDFWINGNLLWVTPKDMKTMYIEDTEDKITEIAVDNSSTKLIQNEAILFVVRSGILRRILPVAITTRPVTVNQDMKALVPKDIDIKFLYWYCIAKESDIRTQCAKNGTTVESISADLLYKYRVLIPLIKEQNEIVCILDNILENEQKAKELCDVIDKIDLIKKSILARAFRGELSTNNPDEESAMELLKEVLREKAEG